MKAALRPMAKGVRVNIKILYDNNASDSGFLTGWGFSCLVDNKVLFDTGGDGKILMSNMKRMEVNPPLIEDIVISHDHRDHTGGLAAVIKGREDVNIHACSGFSPEFKQKVGDLRGNLIEHDGFFGIRKGISVTGMIPGKYKAKDIEEQALVISTSNGLTVITGCAHPGIVKIVEKVKEKFNAETIYRVLGGFHLSKKRREEIADVAEKLKSLRVRKIGPCHCTGDEAVSIFRESFAGDFLPIAAGKELEV